MRPACIGGPGTVISFGPNDNRGYKGDYIVLREVVGGVEQLIDLSIADLLQSQPLGLGTEDATDDPLLGSGSGYALAGERTPFKVGVLQDWALWARLPLWYNGLRLAFDEAYESGRIDRQVELVIEEVEGPPERDAAGVIRGVAPAGRRPPGARRGRPVHHRHGADPARPDRRGPGPDPHLRGDGEGRGRVRVPDPERHVRRRDVPHGPLPPPPWRAIGGHRAGGQPDRRRVRRLLPPARPARRADHRQRPDHLRPRDAWDRCARR